jgi:hypothetical protein
MGEGRGDWPPVKTALLTQTGHSPQQLGKIR